MAPTMRIDSPTERLFFCTLRVETESAEGTGYGTGFLFSVELEDERVAHFLVTNKHVIERAALGRFWFHQSKDNQPVLGSPVHVEIDEFASRFFPHPDPNVDIAIMPIGGTLSEVGEKHGQSLFTVFLDSSLIPEVEKIQELEAIEEILFVGYPNAIYDTANYLPVARRGHTATPIQVDYQGKRTFLIDASVFPGSSGSPVFILNHGGYSVRGVFGVGSRTLLVGVISAVHTRDEYGWIVERPAPTTNDMIAVSQMINLGIVVKSSAVEEACWLFLESQGVKRPGGRIIS